MDRPDQGRRQEERAQDRKGVEPEPAVEVREPTGWPQPDREAAVEAGQGDHERDVPGPALRRIGLAGDQRARQGVDRDAHESEEMRRAPQGHVDSKETVPEVVDRRRENGQRDPARRQEKAGRAADPEDALGTFGRAAGAPVPERVTRQHAEAGQDDEGHPAVGHDVRRNPERVAADPHVPHDVPLHAPPGQQVGAQQDPERSAIEAERCDTGRGRLGRTSKERGLHGAHRCFSRA